MNDKLSVSERRLKMLELLRIKRHTTRRELADEFNVSLRTITRDLYYLNSEIAPITMKHGNRGGVHLDTGILRYRTYLTDKEENYLYSAMKKADNEEKGIIHGIIVKFTRKSIFKDQNV